MVDKGIWKSKPGRYTAPWELFSLTTWSKTLRASNHERGTAAEKEIMIQMRVSRHAACPAEETGREQELGYEFLWFISTEGQLKSPVWRNCLHVRRSSWDSAVFLSLHQIPLSKKSFLWSRVEQSGAEPPASLISEHVMLLWVIMLPCGSGSGKTLPYVVRACFPFKIYEWISRSRFHVHAAGDGIMFGIPQRNAPALMQRVCLWFRQWTLDVPLR